MHRFPGNKKFAFSVFDDTDLCTVTNIDPVYRFLADLGMLTTKSVWPLPATDGNSVGDSLADPEYLKFIRKLQSQGFEIGLHNARSHAAPRSVTEQGLQVFEDLLSQKPRTFSN